MAEHDCLHEYDFGVIQQSLKNIESSIKKINGIPGKVEGHGLSISRLWKFIYGILFVIGGGLATTAYQTLFK